MILFIECIIACVIFGVGIVGSVLVDKEFYKQFRELLYYLVCRKLV